MNSRDRDPLNRFMSDPDVGLMLEFQAGDSTAFNRLVERHTDGLVTFFFFQGAGREQAEDCAQEVWAKVFRSRRDYAPRASFATYLYAVARNLWIDVYRSSSRRPTPSSLSGDSDPLGSGPLSERVAAPGAVDPREDVAAKELAHLLAHALARLPAEMREVYVLGEVEGLPYAEVASVLGIPLGTVKSRMFNAVRRLKYLLEPKL